MKRSLLFFTLSALICFGACNNKVDVGPEDPTPPVDTTKLVPPSPVDTMVPLNTPIPKDGYKIATLWIDLTANISKFTTKARVCQYLDKIQDTGFNGIVLDIKGTSGTVMYDSGFLKKATTVNKTDVTAFDYDFVPFFIEECHKRELRITLSTCVMPMGDQSYQADPEWDGHYAVEYLPSGVKDIRQDPDAFYMLNPCDPYVQDYAVRMAKEIARFDIDGYALDYCRYLDFNSDFSETTHKAMEEYFGETIDNWPECVYTWPAGKTDKDRTSFTPGPYYKKFCEFKAYTVKQVVSKVRAAVKEVNPNIDIEYWASAWWPLAGTGQNWASPDKDKTSAYSFATADYYKTGFARELDIFQLGAYTSTLYGTGTDSIQGLILQGKNLIRKNCTMYGTISACVNAKFLMAESCYLCLQETDGLMVFDLSHVQANNWWRKCKLGIMQYRDDYENPTNPKRKK